MATTINQVEFPKVFIAGPSGYIADVDSTGHLLTTGGSGGSSVIDGVTVTGTPSVGQVLTATSPTAADWATPSAGGGSELTANWRFARSALTTCLTASVTGPVTINFPTAFADNYYTVQVSAVCNEAPMTQTVVAQPVIVCLMELQAAGAGVTVWIENADSGTHYVTVNVMARHD